ncbi:MAG: hypothetical protein OXP74_17725 [Acidobacteriota bacterium]|nr:hypothetical protein [Acidobacteriota bacterium]
MSSPDTDPVAPVQSALRRIARQLSEAADRSRRMGELNVAYGSPQPTMADQVAMRLALLQCTATVALRQLKKVRRTTTDVLGSIQADQDRGDSEE